MSRLIDADSLKECYAGTNALDGKADYMSIRKMIDNQPTANVDKDVREEAYNKGLEDAWELTKKLWLPTSYGGKNSEEVMKIFGCDYYAISKLFTPQEALAKLEAYEKAQVEIKVGDVVERIDDGKQYLIITEEKDDSCFDFGVIDLYEMGIDRICNSTKYFRKTDKHVDIQSILQQIGGE